MFGNHQLYIYFQLFLINVNFNFINYLSLIIKLKFQLLPITI